MAPTCPPWYESPLRDCTLMNKSPEFDMLKEPAEPENTQSQRRREQESKTTNSRKERKSRGRGEERKRGTEKGVKMIMHEQK